MAVQANVERLNDILEAGVSWEMKSRGITEETCKKFGVTQRRVADSTCPSGMKSTDRRYPFYDRGTGVLCGVSIKNLGKSKSRFRSEGDTTKKAGLFGSHLFPAGSSKKITITEGCDDTLAHSQIFYNKYPVVSVPNGASSALKACELNFEYLDSFDEIYICFDGDRPGQEAARKVLELFIHKAKLVHHVSGYKDACDYLLESQEALYRSVWWAAQEKKPEGLVVASEAVDRALAYTQEKGLDFPWTGLTEMTHGLMPSQFVLCVGGTGCGKTTFFKEFIHWFKPRIKGSIGVIFLEEEIEETLLDLAGLTVNKIFYARSDSTDAQTKKEAVQNYVQDNKLFLMNYESAQKFEKVSTDIRYLVKAKGCQQIYVDHISRLIDRKAGRNEREQLEAIAEGLDNLRIELGIQLFVNIHTNRARDGKTIEEGGRIHLDNIRGSDIPGKVAQIVIAFERNTQADAEIERNTTKVRLLKVRKGGNTGVAAELLYNRCTGRLQEAGLDGFLNSGSNELIDGDIKE